MILLNWKLNHHCNCSRPLTVSLYLPFSELRHNWLINVMAIHVYPPFPFYCYLLFWMDGGINERRVLYCTTIAAHDAKINLDNSISEGRTCSRPRKTGSVFVGQQSEDFNKRERLVILIRWGEWITTSSDFFVTLHWTEMGAACPAIARIWVDLWHWTLLANWNGQGRVLEIRVWYSNSHTTICLFNINGKDIASEGAN